MALEDRDKALWIGRLTLTQFRSYDRASLSSDGRPVVLTGPNGAGKTNLLEAISLLAPGRGLRRAKLADLSRREGGAPWAVAARLMTPEGARDIGTGAEPAGQNGERERRVVKIDGAVARSQRALAEISSVVWLTPQMDGLFREGSAGRRRFLDRLVYAFDPAHAERVKSYEHALRERARVLKFERPDDSWLGSLEEAMANHGIAVVAARRALVARLAAACGETPGPFPRAALSLVGAVDGWLDEGSALAAEDRLREALATGRREDALGGGAAVGPHRSDLAVRHLDNDLPAELCSTGQQKALLLSIVLAHARLLTLDRGHTALLLLDEVVAHLDSERRAALFEALVALGTQSWLTGTDRGSFAELGQRAQFFQVCDGQVTPA